MRPFIELAVVLGVLAWGQVAHAQVTTYSDRAGWQSAVAAPVQVEGFNSFVTDTSFQSAVVPLLNMAITQINGISDPTKNFIDVFPFAEDGKRSIDGTPYVLGEVADTGTIIRIDFTSPITGWGADLISHDPNTVIDIFDQSNNLIGTTASVADETTFYGFHLDAGASAGRIEIKFIGQTNDLFGMDNLSFVQSSSGVPDPVVQIQALADAVDALESLGTISGGVANSLRRKLEAAQRQADRRPRAAAGMLLAFILQVGALVLSGNLDFAPGQSLITGAVDAISSLLAP